MTGSAPFGMLIDGLVAILLVATIVMTAMLHRKLTGLRKAKNEMEVVIGRLIETTEAAKGGLSELHRHAQETGKDLQEAIERARGAADELSFLVERAGAMSRGLEKSAPSRRDRAPSVERGPAPARRGSGPAAPSAAPLGDGPPAVESKLLKALQGVR